MKKYIIFILAASILLNCSKKSEKIIPNDYQIIKEIMKKQKKFNITPDDMDGGSLHKTLFFDFLADTLTRQARKDSAVGLLHVKYYEGYLDDLYKLKNLYYLSISNPMIMPDFSKFPKLKSVTIIKIKDKKYTTLDLDNFKNIEKIHLVKVKLKSILFKNNTSLKQIYITKSDIQEEFKIENGHKLSEIHISDTRLNKINLKSMPHLKILLLLYSRLKQIDLGELPMIEQINLGSNCPSDTTQKYKNYLQESTILKIKEKFKPMYFRYVMDCK